MKYFKIIIILLGVIIIGSPLFLYNHTMRTPIKIDEKIIDYSIGDVVGDKRDYMTILTKGKGDYGEYIVIYSLDDEREIYREDFSHLNPWKLSIGDIDGDGIKDISLGVYKESPLHPIMAKRPFIYSYKDERIVPKWRGSRLSRPFDDYLFYDIDDDGVDEIVAIEILEDKRRLINTYKWKGFGFEGYLETADFENIEDLRIEDDNIFIQIYLEEEKCSGVLKLDNGNLIIERVD